MNLYPNSQTNLYGLQDNLLVFAKLFDQKRLPSKILLTGQKGIGKCTLAYHLINFVLSILNTDKLFNCQGRKSGK